MVNRSPGLDNRGFFMACCLWHWFRQNRHLRAPHRLQSVGGLLACDVLPVYAAFVLANP